MGALYMMLAFLAPVGVLGCVCYECTSNAGLADHGLGCCLTTTTTDAAECNQFWWTSQNGGYFNLMTAGTQYGGLTAYSNGISGATAHHVCSSTLIDAGNCNDCLAGGKDPPQDACPAEPTAAPTTAEPTPAPTTAAPTTSAPTTAEPTASNGVVGDPTSIFEGRSTRFWLEISKSTSLFTQPPGIEVVVVGGPPLPKGTSKDTSVRRGDWMTRIDLLVGGERAATATVRQPVAALIPDTVASKTAEAGVVVAVVEKGEENAPPALRMPWEVLELTTLNLTVNGVAINTTGAVKATVGGLPIEVSVHRSSKPMGKGHAESATITVGSTFRMTLWTSKAHKFESLAEQLTYSHLDFKLLTFDRAKATGALPEMWGLQPMSAATQALVSPPQPK